MANNLDDILNEALLDFERHDVIGEERAARLPPGATSVPLHSQLQSSEQPSPTLAGSSDASKANEAQTATETSSQPKKLAFDPLRKTAPKPPTAQAKVPSAVAEPADNQLPDWAKLPTNFEDLAKEIAMFASSSAANGPPRPPPGSHRALPPELQKLADEFTRLAMEVGPDSDEGPMPSTSTKQAPKEGSTAATLKALQEATQRVAAQQQQQQAAASQGDAGVPPGLAGVPPGLADLFGGASGGPGAAGMGGLTGLLDLLGGNGGAGAGSNQSSMNSIVDSIMTHLLSKDVLYPAMKEIEALYPPWLEQHAAGLATEARQRYVQQHEYVKAICHLYETEPSQTTRLLELMQQMQACGDPPEDIVVKMQSNALRDLPEMPDPGVDDGVPHGQDPKCPIQ